MPKFNVPVRFVFEGKFSVEARCQEEANNKVRHSCGMVNNNGVHTSLPENDCDFEFPVHAEKILIH